MLRAKRFLLSGYSVAVIVSLLTLLLRFLLVPILEENAPLLIFILPVLFSAWYGGSKPGLLATALCAFLGTYFFVLPHFSLQVLDLANCTRIIIFLIEGVCISGLNGALRRAKDRAERVALTLKESEEQYRLLVEGVKDYAIFGLDPQGRVTSWSSGAEVIEGYKAAEASGRHFSLFYTEPDVAQGKPDRNLQIATTEGHYEDEGWRRRKDGSLFWANVLITALRDENGQLYGFSKIVRDITQQKRSEEALQESYGILQTVIEGTGDAIFVKDRQGRYKLANSATGRILGKPKEEILGQDDTAFLPLEVAAFLQQVDRTVMETGQSRTFEEELPEVNGTRVFLTTKDPYRDAQGNVLGIIGIARDITERKQAEATQQQLLKDLSDVKFALDQAAILVTTDERGVITEVNDKFCEISKFSRDELIGQTHRLINSGYHPKEFFRNLWLTITHGEVWHGEIRNRAKDGTYYWVDTTIVPLLDASGKPFQYLAIRFDITARKQAEQLLTQEKTMSDLERKRLEAVLEILPVGVLIADDIGRMVKANAAMTAIWGEKTPQLNDIDEYHHFRGWWTDTQERISAHEWGLARAIEQGETSLNEEIDIENFDGECKTILNSAVPIKDETGAIANAVVVNVDITQRKQAEQQLRRSAQRLEVVHHIDRAILSATSADAIAQSMLSRLSPIIPYDQAAVVLFNIAANEAHILAGETATDATGSTFLISDRLPLEMLKYREPLWYVKNLANLMQRPIWLEQQFAVGYHTFLAVALGIDGTFLGDLVLFAKKPNAFDLEDQQIAQEIASQLAIAIQQAQFREELQRYAEELEQRVAERTAALQDALEGLEAFSYSASHDLRAPLRAMQGLSQALLEDYGHQFDATAQLYAQEIAASAQRADALVTDLLDYGRLSRADIKVQPLNLTELVANTLTYIEDDLQPRNAQVTVRNPLPEVMGHRVTLIQVMLNLLTNALKFVPSDRQPQVQIWAELRSGWVRLWIADNGIGIAPEYQERIFQAFERLHTSEQYPGTGVGLAIVRRGMERMGGQVGVESVLGQGSCFWIELREVNQAE